MGSTKSNEMILTMFNPQINVLKCILVALKGTEIEELIDESDFKKSIYIIKTAILVEKSKV